MTKIEWADVTWNPITGCSPVSEACENCYAKRMANRLRGRYGYPKDEPFRVTFHPDRLSQPLKWKKPKRIFVCSMGDLFHGLVHYTELAGILDVIRQATWHTFLLLTKRPLRMAERLGKSCPPNCWLGVTAENQKRADERIPILLQIPAAVRFISIEPMLGPIDLEYLLQWHCPQCNSLNPQIIWPCPDCKGKRYSQVDWVIVGGETGPRARPMHPDWVRSIRDQCQDAGVPFFFKSWGEWWLPPSGRTEALRDFKKPYYDHDSGMFKIGKKKAGRILDGREWNEFPDYAKTLKSGS